MTQIAEATGIKKPSIYAHFKSKEDVMAQLFNPRLDRYLEAHYCVPGAASAAERILLLARCTFACSKRCSRTARCRLK